MAGRNMDEEKHSREKNRGKIRQYRKPLNINLGIIIFGVIFIYIIICVFLYFTSKHIKYYEVRYGSLSVGNVYQGLALREETVVTGSNSGYINFYAREGERVASGGLVCSIDESGQLKEILQAQSQEDIRLSDNDMTEIRNEIVTYKNSYDRKQFSGVYDFKTTMKGISDKLANTNALSSLRELTQSAGSQVVMCRAPESGIVVYSTDGMEDLTADEITADHFKQDTYTKNQKINNDLVENGNILYKLETNENWSIVIKTDEKRAQELLEKEYVEVKFLKNQLTSWGAVTVLNNADGPYVKLDFTNSMITFAADRYIDLELFMEEDEGLKVPNTAIANREFYLIPVEYMTKGGSSGEQGVMREVYAEDGTASSEFVATPIYHATEEEYYIDKSDLNAGDNLLLPDSLESKFTVSSSATLIGVYNINKGYADFCEIQILHQSDEYAIVKSNTTYGLSAYDHIVQDAETVNENDLIYE